MASLCPFMCSESIIREGFQLHRLFDINVCVFLAAAGDRLLGSISPPPTRV